jgi:hypothetical protein
MTRHHAAFASDDSDGSRRPGPSTITVRSRPGGPPCTDYYRLISRSCFQAPTPTGGFARTGSHGYTIQASVVSA